MMEGLVGLFGTARNVAGACPGAARAAFLSLSLAIGAGAPLGLRATDLAPGGAVVISEISYNPPSSLGPDSLYEFVEIHNRGAGVVDVSAWRLRNKGEAEDFVFPQGTLIASGGYLVLARDAAALRGLAGPAFAVLGDVPFSLDNGGDAVQVLDRAGQLVDEVVYDDDLPWPVAADGDGSTLERISLEDDITDFTNFAASPEGSPGAVNLRRGEIPARHQVVISEIMYHPVKEPDVDPLRHCAAQEFVELFNRGTSAVDVSAWRFVDGISYVFPRGTVIAPGGHLVIYHDAAEFAARYGEVTGALGPYDGELDNGGEVVLLVDDAGRPVDFVDYEDSSPWPVNPDGIQGSLELIDPSSDNERGRAWRESAEFKGTPGAKNSATEAFETAESAGPQITKVRASPSRDASSVAILSSDTVEIEARVVSRKGVAAVLLEYQDVAPGAYIRRSDPEFETRWAAIEMLHDAARGRYVATLPAFPHRTLVRYRVLGVDADTAVEARAPRPRDPEPNYGYFVYDGVPDYVANRRSAFGPPGFTHTDLTKAPVYFIIGAPEDIHAVQYEVHHDRVYRWTATFVHENRVYDHCGLRLRGGGTRYAAPKRNWKVRFNKGNRFRGRSNDGTLYPRPRSKINLMRGGLRRAGEGGVVQTLGWQCYRDAGVLAGDTTIVHLRIIRSREEHDQFDGDFFGTFLEVQAIDTIALRDRGRPVDEASSLYKMNGGVDKKYPDCDPSEDDLSAFREAARTATREWLEENLDVDRYLSFTAVKDLIDDDKDGVYNYFYYFDSSVGKWEVIPWDLDRAFGVGPSGDQELRARVVGLFPIEFGNRFRFLWQLLFAGDRLERLIDDTGRLVRELALADLDRWDTEPNAACPSCTGPPAGQFLSYRPFDERMTTLKRWIDGHRGRIVRSVRDEHIPLEPRHVSPFPGTRPAAPVTLRSGPFQDPDDEDVHAASRWLLIEDGGDWMHPLWDHKTSTELEEVVAPPDATIQGATYWFRVAHMDSTGRWSLFSEPTSFEVGGGDRTPPDAPVGLSVEHVSARSVILSWRPPQDSRSVLGFIVLRDERAVVPRPLTALTLADTSPRLGARHSYRVVTVDVAGTESPPSNSVEVEIPSEGGLGGWRLPAGGLDYLYDAQPGEDRFADLRVYSKDGLLDGTWDRSTLDDWDGSAPGEGEGQPGGVAVHAVADSEGGAASVLSLEDAGRTSGPDPRNGRLIFLRRLGATNPFEDGVTLVARLRVNPEPLDLPGPASQGPGSPLRGQVGISRRVGRNRLQFPLWLNDGRLFMTGDHSIPVNMLELQAVWATIEPEDGGHRVKVYLGGRTEPEVDALMDLSSTSTEASFDDNYLEMGLANRSETGAIQIDYFGYRLGVHAPIALGDDSRARFVRGDVDADGTITASDGVRILAYIFRRGARVTCQDAADTDDSGTLNLSDAVGIFAHLFRGGPPPGVPFPSCGQDPSEDDLEPCGESECPGG